MKARMIHENLHVLDMDASLAFYKKALGLEPVREVGPADSSWKIAFLANDTTDFELELTWNKGRNKPYDNGSEDTHLAFAVSDFDEAHALHEDMGCIVYENYDMGIYFITDPDGCWLEILPEKPPESAK
ncbi:MAG: VOC family protein [Coriobacteriales bacterium]|jgi:lactoylglutathione lyase|nr:VOC family protein [Coriobacteriales bacterium]